jgi:hypothetical protein
LSGRNLLSGSIFGKFRHSRISVLRFSFGTLVTDHIQYAAMRASFEARGFRGDDCEYLIVDNSAGNVADAYAGCRDLLNRAKGTFVILCHQDVVAIDDRARLEACLAELDAIDPTWAVAGNAGGTVDRLFIRISDRSGSDQNAGLFRRKSRHSTRIFSSLSEMPGFLSQEICAAFTSTHRTFVSMRIYWVTRPTLLHSISGTTALARWGATSTPASPLSKRNGAAL